MTDPEVSPMTDPGLLAERDRLARTLRETRLQLAMTQSRLNALEQSVTMELGRTLVRAAKRPLGRGVRLPRDLVRLWRDRGPAGAGVAGLALASAQLADLAGGGERLLSALTVPGLDTPGLVIAGVLTERARATLSPDATVHQLLPHDADLMLDSSGADLILIEAAALLAGSAWAYAGDPAGADRGRRLGRLIASARTLGKPVIFVRNVPAHLAPGLDWVAASCDAVSQDGFGVQLARFNPLGAESQDRQPGQPVYAGARDPREPPALRARLDALAGKVQVQVAGEVPWRRAPALYREHAVFVTADPDQAREQRACGARVIMVTGATDELGEAPLTPAEVRAALREIFAEHATPVRLAALARLAGLPDGMVPGRQVAVLARVAGADGAAALSGALRRQRLRPAEVVAVIDGPELACRAAAAALGDLGDLGVRIKTMPGGPDWLGQAAGAARSFLAAPWPADGSPWPDGGPRDEADEWYLLDLACARECSRTDAAGLFSLPNRAVFSS
jgi:hypothetical protein